MSETKLLIHASWSTHNQKPLLSKEILNELILHIIENAKRRSIEITDITGGIDHLHTIIKLHPTQSLAQVIHNLKGESSSWINSSFGLSAHFEWQEGYTAVTISPAEKGLVRKYFINHEILHRKMSYLQENRLLKLDKLKDL